VGQFTAEGDLRGSAFVRSDLSGARFRDAGLAGVRMRGVDLSGADVDGIIDGLRVLGVEVAPLIAAELDRRHPERAIFTATEPDALRAGWAGLEAMWTATVQRVLAMPPGTADVSVDGEFSFAQTLRHLVLGIDGWLGQAIMHEERPFHPLGVLFWEAQGHEGHFGLVAPDAVGPFAEVVAVRSGRQAMVRDFLADVTAERLAAVCGSTVWDDAPGAGAMTVLDCLRVIFDEEWNHHRYAVRDLDAIDAGG
jgi:DinB superfamily/Pentapeptide repeats (8 copies)